MIRPCPAFSSCSPRPPTGPPISSRPRHGSASRWSWAPEHAQAMADEMGDRAVVVPLVDPDAGADAIVALARAGADRRGGRGRRPGRGGRRRSRAIASGSPTTIPGRSRPRATRRSMRASPGGRGVPQPRFRVAGRPRFGGRARDRARLPVVVKPVGLSASRGVIRADDPAAATAAAARIRAIVDGPARSSRSTCRASRSRSKASRGATTASRCSRCSTSPTRSSGRTSRRRSTSRRRGSPTRSSHGCRTSRRSRRVPSASPTGRCTPSCASTAPRCG